MIFEILWNFQHTFSEGFLFREYNRNVVHIYLSRANDIESLRAS